MTDKIINTVALMAITTIAAGVLIAIWFGIVGLRSQQPAPWYL